MVAKPLSLVIEIRAYIDSLKEEIKGMNKKAANQKKRLLMVQKVLEKANKEMNVFR